MSHRRHRSARARGGSIRPAHGSAPGRHRVQAAGALPWRHSPDGGLELLLVRSTRWGDWSWPKGKLEPGETLPECAVREVAEETGVRVELGVPLPSTSYLLPDGQDKTVHYWAGRVRHTGLRTALPDEISDVAWLSPEAVLERLIRPGDRAPLVELLALHRDGLLSTRPLLVVRHAKARSRAHWDGGEADRPLTAAGRRQAQGLAGLLDCWDPERILCSPWARCMQTLQPYLDHLEKLRGPGELEPSPPEVVPLLSEQGLHTDPDRVTDLIAELLGSAQGSLVCTHRPVLESVLKSLAGGAVEPVRERLPAEDPWLTPAEILVAHVCDDPRLPAGTRIRTVEQHRGAASLTVHH